MNYGHALQYAKQGYSINRKAWENARIEVKAQFPDKHSKMTKPYLYMEKRGDRFPLDLSCESIFAEDWYVVDNEELGAGGTSDGYHTFDELYFYRMMLFSIVCNQNKAKAWKSKLHADGTMYENYFIVGITTEEGDYTYHYHMQDFDRFDVKEVEKAPEWDGHKPEDITRLLSLV